LALSNVGRDEGGFCHSAKPWRPNPKSEFRI
jgi:hypothetical protein